MNSKQYDIIVIGAGSGGLNVASFMNRIGKRVLLIDKTEASIGGDCLNFGCVPSKALIHVARKVKSATEAREFGVVGTGKVDWTLVRNYIKEKQDIIREHENKSWFESKGMTVVLGEAKFSGPNSIVVSDITYTAKKIVLATGSRPRTITSQGIEKVGLVLNNENIFSIDRIPDRLLVIGSGPIGIEMSQAFQFLGSQVTVIDPGSKILGKEDAEISEILKNRLINDGLDIQLETKLKEFTGPGSAMLVNNLGEEFSIDFDAVFVSIGRSLNVQGLDLEKGNIALHDHGGLMVDQNLRTTNKNVYVCGDVAGNFQFTHAAEMHAAVIIKNLLSPIKTKFSGDKIAWVTYTSPEIATFGLPENVLKERKISYKVVKTSFAEDDRAITDNYQYGLLKLLIGPKGKILGGSMVAPGAGELIQELILAQSAGLSLNDLFNKVYPYPTASRINKTAAASFAGEKLTPVNKRLLSFLFNVFS